MTEKYKKRLCGYIGALVLLLGLLTGCAPAPESSGGSGFSYNPAVGKVTVYTCDPQLYRAFSALGQRYTQATGIYVNVLTAASGDCQTDLDELMDSENAPTIFCIHDQQQLGKWSGQLLDLSDSAVVKALCSPAFGLQWQGKTLAVTADTQAYGLVYNAALLARAGFTRSDIRNFTDLQMVSQYITDRSLGYSAFAAPDLTSNAHLSMACLLAGIAGSPESLRSFWDLYIRNEHSEAKGLAAFLESGSVFCLGGTWEYDAFASLGSGNLDIMPAYTADGGGLRYLARLCWGVNAEAPSLDAQQALTFLEWLVTAGQDSPAPVEELGLFAPFRDAVSYANPLEKRLRAYMLEEPAAVSWRCCPALTEEALARLSAALEQYRADPTDENWGAVQALFG